MEIPDLSIIVPLYNEGQNVAVLYRRLKEELDRLQSRYEILFVDDGSQDETFKVAGELAARDPALRVIKFRKNYGQTPAMAAGIDHARGRILVTMDGDLQNDPADIPILIAKIDEGYDIAAGWRYERQDRMLTRKVPSVVANWLIAKLVGIPIKDNGCSLKAYRATIIKSLPMYSEMHRFIPALSSLTGARIAEVRVRHHARQHGESKYGLSRIYRVLIDLLAIKTIISFASRPLIWFAALALPSLCIAAFAMAATLYLFLSPATDYYPVSIAGVSVLFGALTIFMLMGGVAAEIIYKTGDVDLRKLALLTASETPERKRN